MISLRKELYTLRSDYRLADSKDFLNQRRTIYQELYIPLLEPLTNIRYNLFLKLRSQ